MGSCAESEATCSIIEDDLNAICSAPDEWTCYPDQYGDGTCTCGCGAFDMYDCTDASVGSCEYCSVTGACDEDSEDCSEIDEEANWLCQ